MSASSIRPATAKDLKAVKDIIEVSFPRFFRYFAWHSVSDLEEPTIVLEYESVIAGFAKLIEFKISGEMFGCILWIAVKPEYRRKGVAFSLTNSGVEQLNAKGAKAVFASTQRHNKAALGALGKSGFERIGFLGLRRMFGWSIFRFYGDIWYAPGEVVLIHQEHV